MRRFVAAVAATSALTLVGAPALAGYPPTTETEIEAEPKGKVKPGKRTKIVVKPGVKGDAAQCTGSFVIIYKDGAKVLREREKPVAERVRFNGRTPKGTDKIFVIYKRGPKDPCDKSRTRVYKR